MNAETFFDALAKIGDEPSRIQQLRQVVVALAITGKLDPAIETFRPGDIAAAIDETRARLVELRVVPKPKMPAPFQVGQVPKGFEDASRFVRLGRVARIDKGLTGIKQAKPGPFPLVVTGVERASCDHFDFDGAAAIIPLVSSTGHGHASIHRLHYQEGSFALGTILAAVTPYEPALISARFLFEYLSAFKDELLVSRMTGTANVTLSVGRIAEVPVPLIDPAIQAKVDDLMALLDQLESARSIREAVRDRLAASSLARLDAPHPETVQQDARFVLEALPALTTRPDQIKAVRQNILNLAVRGKLVEQDSKDEPASGLLERIAKEKARLVNAGVVPAKKEPVRDPRWLADGLPASWSSIALGRVCNLVTSGSRGWAEYYSTAGPGFIRAQNIRFGKLRLDEMAFVSPPANSEGSRTCVAKGDLLIVITGAGVTNPALLDHDPGEAYVSQHVGLVRPSDQQLSKWLLLCLMADAGGRAELVERAYGAGKPGLNLDNIRSLSVPLPPLAEQHRILAKVGALMALCDRLEAALTAAENKRARLFDALLHAALKPPSMAQAA